MEIASKFKLNLIWLDLNSDYEKIGFRLDKDLIKLVIWFELTVFFLKVGKVQGTQGMNYIMNEVNKNKSI